MSELPAGAVSLEDDPVPGADAPPPADPPPADPPPNPEDALPDGTIEGSGGVKFVPLSALAAAREAARTAKAEAAALRGKAERLDQIAGEWEAAKPMLEKARQITSQQPPPEKPAGPLNAQEAIEYARDFDLFKPDGTPDVERAQRIAARHAGLAQQQAQAMVTPLLQHTAQGQSRAHLEQAAAFKDAKGQSVDRAILERVWAGVPPEMSAQPQVAAILYRVALAEAVMAGQYRGHAPAPPPPPLHTDPIGGGSPGAPSLSAVDHAFRSAAEMSEKSFTETRDRYKPGAVNSLE